MTRPSRLATLVVAAGVVSVGGCDECSGTPACTIPPEVSYTAQFIERASGHPVPGVRVTFAPAAGVGLVTEPSGVTDGKGFVLLRAAAVAAGSVTGELLVSPPPPHAAFVIPAVQFTTTTSRGDGGNLGRLVVDPYMFLVGRVTDGATQAPIVGARVVVRRISGGRTEPDSAEFMTDAGGQFGWEPAFIERAPIVATFEITAPGYPRPYLLQRELRLSYRDVELTFVSLPIGEDPATSIRAGATSGRQRGAARNTTATLFMSTVR